MKIRYQLLIGSLGALIGSIISWLIFYFCLHGDISSFVKTSTYLLSEKNTALTYDDYIGIRELIDKNVIFSSQDLLGQLGYFYSSIIVILIAMLTLVTAITLLFVKSGAEDKAAQQAKVVARQIIADKLEPQITIIDNKIAQLTAEKIQNRINETIEIMVFDSARFWSKSESILNKKAEDAIDTYAEETTQTSQIISEMQKDIRQLTQSIQVIKNDKKNDKKNDHTLDHEIIDIIVDNDNTLNHEIIDTLVENTNGN